MLLSDFGHSGEQSAEKGENGAPEGLTDRHSGQPTYLDLDLRPVFPMRPS
jgi:hypothetical protein